MKWNGAKWHIRLSGRFASCCAIKASRLNRDEKDDAAASLKPNVLLPYPRVWWRCTHAAYTGKKDGGTFSVLGPIRGQDGRRGFHLLNPC